MSAKMLRRGLIPVTAMALVFAALGVVAVLPALAANEERGRALYENQCQSCHEQWAHSRTSRKAKSLADLQRLTAAWSTHAGLEWNAEEIDDVVGYLDAKFYHFK